MSGSEQNRPQVIEPALAFGAHGMLASARLCLALMKHEIRVSLLPRWIYIALLWGIGVGAAAALALAAVSLAEERKLDETIAQLARNARAMLPGAAVARLPEANATAGPALDKPLPPPAATPPAPAKRRAAKARAPKPIPTRAERMQEALRHYRELNAARHAGA